MGTRSSKNIKTSRCFGSRCADAFTVFHRDPKHAEWVRAYYGVMDGLRTYVKEYHTTGLTWNPKASFADVSFCDHF